MNKKIFLLFAAVMVLALGVAGFAYKRSSATTTASASSCCGDSCPMKSKQTASTGEAKTSCCDCCDGDSCPMHKGEHGEKMAAHTEGMPENCPMHSKDAKAQNASATADGKKSCDCSCCNHNKETAATAPAV